MLMLSYSALFTVVGVLDRVGKAVGDSVAGIVAVDVVGDGAGDGAGDGVGDAEGDAEGDVAGNGAGSEVVDGVGNGVDGLVGDEEDDDLSVEAVDSYVGCIAMYSSCRNRGRMNRWKACLEETIDSADFKIFLRDDDHT